MLRIKRFSKILNTNLSGIGFTRSREYDTDLNRLGRMESSQRELHKIGDLGTEIRTLGKSLDKTKELISEKD